MKIKKNIIRGLVGLYECIGAPFFGGNCRYIPSCSHYAEEALQRHRFLVAAALIMKRMLRCHPWGAAGFDPVPRGDVKECS